LKQLNACIPVLSIGIDLFQPSFEAIIFESIQVNRFSKTLDFWVGFYQDLR